MTSLEPGTTLGRYRVVHRIGAGGMGEVYRCRDLQASRDVAVKVLTEEAAGNRARLQRFLREAALASSLHHPHIVRVYGMEEADGRPILVMEYVDGEDLGATLERGPVPWVRALEWGGQIAGALEAAHQAGLLHRDIKSSNILVASDGLAKVADFGLVKQLRPPAGVSDATASASLTEAGAVLGTASYMSPEQTRGETLDARSDLFSLGVVLYEAVTGRRPFEGETALAVQHEIALVEPPPPSRVRPGLPRSLDRVLLRALAKDRARRYATAAEFGAALREAAQPARGDEEPETAPAAPRLPERTPDNLPPTPTRFIGRRDEMEELGRLLESVRFVTVSGAGGCGKSRLAVEVARNRLEAYPDGAWFVALAPLTDASLLPQRIAAAVGVRERPGRPVLDSILEHLADRTFLLILDNAEHVAEACGRVASRLVAECPKGSVMVTTRTALGAGGETLWRLPPLGAPGPRELATLTRSELSRYEAVRLFVDRAASVSPGFALHDENAAAVGQICARLDGIPLAVELAAARVKVLPLPDIVRRLEDRFRLLTAGAPGALPHHQTLRATVEWSYTLLGAAERELFARLAVFAGGASLEAVETICADETLAASGVLDVLTHLVDQSLLVPAEGVGGTARYRMLETLRQYGIEKLEEAGSGERLRERHASHFLDLVEGAERLLSGPEQSRWLEALEEDHDNLRAALAWTVASGRNGPSLRFCAALWRFWLVRGYFTEGRECAAAALRLTGEGDDIDRARMRALRGAAALARGQSDFASTRALLEESLRLARRLGDREGVSEALWEAGSLADTQGDYTQARSRYEESLALCRERGDRRGIAGLLHNLGVVTQEEGDLDRAQALYAEALAIHRELGNAAWEASALSALASVALEQERFAEARERQEASLAVHDRLGDKWGKAYTLHELGRLGVLTADLEYARRMIGAGLALFRELGDRLGIVETIEYAAMLAAAEGNDERAVRLAGAASAHRDSMGTPATDSDRTMLEDLLARSRERLGAVASAAAWEQGRRLELDRLIDLAMPRGNP